MKNIEVIIDRETLSARVTELGREISEFYKDKPLTVIVLMTGGMIFASDLVRAMDIPLWIDSLSVASYHGHASSGELKFRSELKMSVRDRHVLIVDEVFDTGLTLSAVRAYLSSAGALSVKAAVAVIKDVARPTDAIMPEFFGFQTPDRYLIGYGLDSNEDGRQIPFIGAL